MARLSWADVVAVGVGIAGLVDSRAGLVVDAGNLGWHDLALGRRSFPSSLGVPVVIENDVCASAIAELAVLPGGPVSPWLYLSVGTGVGACVVARHGRRASPVPQRRPSPRARGVVASARAASTGAWRRSPRAPPSRGRRPPASPPTLATRSTARAATVTGKDVVDSAMAGRRHEPRGAGCGRRSLRHAVANLVNMFIPAGVGLAGGMMAPGSPYLVALLDAARSDITPWMQAKFEFRYGRLGERAGVTGVVELAKRRLAAARRPPPRPRPAVTPGPLMASSLLLADVGGTHVRLRHVSPEGEVLNELQEIGSGVGDGTIRSLMEELNERGPASRCGAGPRPRRVPRRH